MRTAIIGGTGPTGPHLVRGLEARGHEVTVVHTGRHEVAEVAHVEHVHLDVTSAAALGDLFRGREFDSLLATYGRLRTIAESSAGRVGRFLSVGGVPAYKGFFDAGRWTPSGLPVPTNESAPTSDEADDGKSYRIARTEELVFSHHPSATHFRYPYLYGPRQPVPREWCVVRRILDGRRRVILPDGGLTLASFAYVENAAHLVLCAIDRPEESAGQIFNVADRETMTLRQVVELIALELDVDVDVVAMPARLAWPAWPFLMRQSTTHTVFDITKAVRLLGYDDIVPARTALGRAARWLVDNPPEPGGIEERILQDPFDYDAEDELLAAWDSAVSKLGEPTWTGDAPGYGVHYAGPGTTYARPDTRI